MYQLQPNVIGHWVNIGGYELVCVFSSILELKLYQDSAPLIYKIAVKTTGLGL